MSTHAPLHGLHRLAAPPSITEGKGEMAPGTVLARGKLFYLGREPGRLVVKIGVSISFPIDELQAALAKDPSDPEAMKIGTLGLALAEGKSVIVCQVGDQLVLTIETDAPPQTDREKPGPAMPPGCPWCNDHGCAECGR